MFFHQPTTASRDEILAGNVKEFTVEKDTPWLPLPGLIGPRDEKGNVTVERVRINGVDLPARRPMNVRDFRLTEERLPAIATDMPMYAVLIGADGTPVLARNVCSNNGKWQKGATISVWGQWEGIAAKAVPVAKVEKPDPAKVAADTVKKLKDLSIEQLREQAASFRILPAEDATADDIIALILKAAGLPDVQAPAYQPGTVPQELLDKSMDELRQIAIGYGVKASAAVSRAELAKMIAVAAGYKIE